MYAGSPSLLTTTRSLSSPRSVGAQPDRAVLLVDPAEPRSRSTGPLDRAALVQVVLVEVDVEVDAEVVQRGLDLLEHPLHALAAEDLLRVVLLEGVGDVGEHRAAMSPMYAPP
jgi:hypothetical protein